MKKLPKKDHYYVVTNITDYFYDGYNKGDIFKFTNGEAMNSEWSLRFETLYCKDSKLNGLVQWAKSSNWSNHLKPAHRLVVLYYVQS
jgi:hypothetical protein